MGSEARDDVRNTGWTDRCTGDYSFAATWACGCSTGHNGAARCSAPRAMIFGFDVGPLFPGFAAIVNIIGDPRDSSRSDGVGACSFPESCPQLEGRTR